MNAPHPTTRLPLVRVLSRRLTPVLAALPVSANQITALSLVAGLAAAWVLARPGPWSGLLAGALLVLCYVLDNCDGEIARMKGQCTRFGMHFDTFVDWLVHSAFFLGLGLGWSRLTGEPAWLLLGAAAAAGGTVNYVLGLVLDRDEDGSGAPAGEPAGPRNRREWVLFAFRELSRADFCFIVLGLGALGLQWVLLPAGAIGAQVYWMTRFFRASRRFHV